MNNEQKIIYNNLIKLSSENEAFYFKDFTIDKTIYRIFNYRLASYTDFLSPSALEARGIMFEIINEKPIRLVARPMEKFFNYRENPFTENIDFSNSKQIMLKEDGSLISSFIHDDALYLKSKGSVDSEQANDSLFWLRKEENEELYHDISDITKLGYTINMEWTSPKNRIVIGYETERLVILNIIKNDTGEYANLKELGQFFTKFTEYVVHDYLDYVNANYDNITDFIEQIKDEKDIEGYVIRTNADQIVKIKTEWYLTLHHVKDSINSRKRLFNAIITESIDDALSMFHDDALLVKQINDLVSEVEPKFNHMIQSVTDYYEENKNLTRKEYAIKAQGLNDGFMSLYMNIYIGTKNDFKKFALKNYKIFIGENSE